MALGVLVGTWGAHIPSVKARYALSEATLSLVLLAIAIGTVSSLFIAGRVVGRLGARNTTLVSASTMSLLLGVALEYPSVALLMPLAAASRSRRSSHRAACSTRTRAAARR